MQFVRVSISGSTVRQIVSPGLPTFSARPGAMSRFARAVARIHLEVTVHPLHQRLVLIDKTLYSFSKMIGLVRSSHKLMITPFRSQSESPGSMQLQLFRIRK